MNGRDEASLVACSPTWGPRPHPSSPLSRLLPLLLEDTVPPGHSEGVAPFIYLSFGRDPTAVTAPGRESMHAVWGQETWVPAPAPL